MADRLELHTMLEAIPGVQKAYFQVPESQQMIYPCIRYKRSNFVPKYADNLVYDLTDAYTLTVILKNPDSSIPRAVASLPGCRFDRHYTSDNLHHYIYNIHF